MESVYSRFELDEQLKFGSNSLTVMDAQTGEVVFSRRPDLGLASASTLKTITSATAFEVLGKGYTWETGLGYNGNLSGGVLNGDLVLIGGGDPTLGSDRFETTKTEVVLRKWVAAIQSAGITQISGSVLSDDRIFGTQNMLGGWTWQDMGNYYGAGPASLTWRENQFDLIFKTGKVGEPAQLVRSEPSMSYLKIVNEVKTGAAGTGDNVYAYSAPYSDVIYLRGTYGIDLNKKIAASVPDPAFDAAYQLQAALEKVGVRVLKGSSTFRRISSEGKKIPGDVKIISRHVSPALEKVIYWFNQKSINLYGEHLIKSIALAQGKDATTEEGVKFMTSFWAKRLSIDPNEMNLYDGSGLSPANRITTSAMADILCSIQSKSWYPEFYSSLPEYNGMKMKSGSISDVLGFTGYHKSSSGKTYVFAFLINNYSGSSSAVRQKMFKVLDLLK